LKEVWKFHTLLLSLQLNNQQEYNESLSEQQRMVVAKLEIKKSRDKMPCT
jgi:hypothetical protein